MWCGEWATQLYGPDLPGMHGVYCEQGEGSEHLWANGFESSSIVYNIFL